MELGVAQGVAERVGVPQQGQPGQRRHGHGQAGVAGHGRGQGGPAQQPPGGPGEPDDALGREEVDRRVHEVGDARQGEQGQHGQGGHEPGHDPRQRPLPVLRAADRQPDAGQQPPHQRDGPQHGARGVEVAQPGDQGRPGREQSRQPALGRLADERRVVRQEAQTDQLVPPQLPQGAGAERQHRRHQQVAPGNPAQAVDPPEDGHRDVGEVDGGGHPAGPAEQEPGAGAGRRPPGVQPLGQRRDQHERGVGRDVALGHPHHEDQAVAGGDEERGGQGDRGVSRPAPGEPVHRGRRRPPEEQVDGHVGGVGPARPAEPGHEQGGEVRVRRPAVEEAGVLGALLAEEEGRLLDEGLGVLQHGHVPDPGDVAVRGQEVVPAQPGVDRPAALQEGIARSRVDDRLGEADQAQNGQPEPGEQLGREAGGTRVANS